MVSKFRCIRSTSTEIASTSKNDFECLARAGLNWRGPASRRRFLQKTPLIALPPTGHGIPWQSSGPVLSLTTKRTLKNRQTDERNRRPPGTNASLSAAQPSTPTLTKGTQLQIVGEIQAREYVAKNGVKKSDRDPRPTHRPARPRVEGGSNEGAAA
jgi:hypothetical protein